MIAEKVRRSPLADYEERFAAASGTSRVSIREIPFLTQINLRAEPSDPELMERFRTVLGVPVPVTPNTTAGAAGRRTLWLGPDEWLVVSPEGERGAIERVLQSALGTGTGSIVDVSANRTVVELAGPQARELMAHGCPLDLHADRFRVGQCAQTLLASAQVILELLDDTPTFYVYVRSSFSWYLADWLLDALATPGR